ncbi:MAG: GNAT family N-acetyltransferase [Gammaproteobacteria bacterium]
MTDTVREYSAAIVDWREHHRVMCAIRRAVFINEQGVSEALEIDPHDCMHTHALARDSAGNGIATGRLCAHDAGGGAGADGQIGRMAVLAAWRGRGVGGAILTRLLEAADARGMRMVSLHAQTHARAFYAARGFVEYGDIFMEAGIKHIRMSRRLR